MVACIACGKTFSQHKGLGIHQRYCKKGYALLAEGLESHKRRQEDWAREAAEKEAAEKIARREEGHDGVRERQRLRDAREIEVSQK